MSKDVHLQSYAPDPVHDSQFVLLLPYVSFLALSQCARSLKFDLCDR